MSAEASRTGRLPLPPRIDPAHGPGPLRSAGRLCQHIYKIIRVSLPSLLFESPQALQGHRAPHGPGRTAGRRRAHAGAISAAAIRSGWAPGGGGAAAETARAGAGSL